MKLMSMYMMTISFMMMFMKHPLSMGLLILMQTFLICMITGMIINTYWFSYILFLIFLGGLLVLFIYVSSIASNELFHFKNKMILILIFFMFIIILYKLNNLKSMKFNTIELNNFFNYYIFFNNENNINLNKLYNSQNYLLMIMMIIYLFITLIAVVKITNIFYGPLRSFN